MPGFDGRGPRGMGPMTGWGRGACNPRSSAFGAPYGAGAGFGRGGWGRGFRGGGRGFGWRSAGPGMRWGWAQEPAWGPQTAAYGMNPEDEAGALRQEAEAVRRELDAIQQRIAELESRDSSS